MEPKRKVLIVGAGGRLGAALMKAYGPMHEVVGFNHAQLDLGDLAQLRAKLDPLAFEVMINCAAQTNVDRCETEREEAFLLNGAAPGVLAGICSAKQARLIHVSTDYVFDGEKTEPYAEEDSARPISVYGESKLAGEEQVLAVSERHLVVRVSWVFGPERPSFIDQMLARARESEEVSAVADKFSTPTYTGDLAGMLPPFFDASSGGGLLHLANAGACSWQEYAQWALDCAHSLGIPMKARKIGAVHLRDIKGFVAKRPVHSVLATEKYKRLTGRKPRHWRDAVAEYVQQFYSKHETN